MKSVVLFLLVLVVQSFVGRGVGYHSTLQIPFSSLVFIDDQLWDVVPGTDLEKVRVEHVFQSADRISDRLGDIVNRLSFLVRHFRLDRAKQGIWDRLEEYREMKKAPPPSDQAWRDWAGDVFDERSGVWYQLNLISDQVINQHMFDKFTATLAERGPSLIEESIYSATRNYFVTVVHYQVVGYFLLDVANRIEGNERMTIPNHLHKVRAANYQIAIGNDLLTSLVDENWFVVNTEPDVSSFADYSGPAGCTGCVRIDLTAVLSDVLENKIVHSLRVINRNGMMGLEISQSPAAEFTFARNVQETTRRSNHTRGVENIDYVVLGDCGLDAFSGELARVPQGYVVTGVAFGRIGNQIGIRLHASRIAWSTGEIVEGTGMWVEPGYSMANALPVIASNRFIETHPVRSARWLTGVQIFQNDNNAFDLKVMDVFEPDCPSTLEPFNYICLNANHGDSYCPVGNLGQTYALYPRLSKMFACTMGGMRVCPPDAFRCANQECISRSWVCDNVNDCRDFSDEVGCGVGCWPYQYRCDNGKCLDWRKTCDGVNDCSPQGDDELGCANTAGWWCTLDQFTCATVNECVHRLLVCDGVVNCSDGSDEAGCTDVSSVLPTITP